MERKYWAFRAPITAMRASTMAAGYRVEVWMGYFSGDLVVLNRDDMEKLIRQNLDYNEPAVIITDHSHWVRQDITAGHAVVEAGDKELRVLGLLDVVPKHNSFIKPRASNGNNQKKGEDAR